MDIGRNTTSPLKLAIWALAKGVILALFSLALAMPVVGMGHGWTGHMPFAQAGFLLFPLAFLRLSIDGQSTGWKTDAGAMALLLALYAVIPLVMIVANGLPDSQSINYGAFGLLLACIAAIFGAYALLSRFQLSALWGDWVMLAFAAICNYLLWNAIQSDGSWPFQNGLFEWLWLGSWSIWQIILIVAVTKHWKQRRERLVA